jgi:hypothetical protein
MSVAVQGLKFNAVELYSLDKNKKVDITNNILSIDYYEDILSPCVTMTIAIMGTGNLYNGLPIRGGEKVVLDISTATGDFVLDGDYGMYVYKVSGYVSDGTKEGFNLHLTSREGLTNETARVQKKYKKQTIDTHVKEILKDVLKTKKYKDVDIEKTSNSYSFIGNNKKPFHTLTWLGPKGIPSTSNSGENGTVAKGVAGFLFFETKDGFNFKSIDKMVSATLQKEKGIPIYSYNNAIQHNNSGTNFSILNYNIEKNIDLMKSLRVGMYANKTYFYDLYTNKLDIFDYNLKDEVKNKLGTQDKISVPPGFEKSPSRILFRMSDTGTLDPDDIKGTSGRDNTDMGKSFGRYNLLFTQSLNMVVPCNVNLRVGTVLEAQFPKVDPSQQNTVGGVDEQQSGRYLIKELRHHFEGNNMITSLKLVRDSYGLY